MKFDLLAKSHLSSYKTNNLNIEENGIYNNILYEHIIPSYLTEENFISYYRDKVLEYIKENNISLNQTNHLNSSKAMGFNFFFPLKEENQIDLLNTYLGLNLSSDYNVSFEEKLTDGTVVDLYLQDNTKKILFELKYAEQDFGSKSILSNNNYSSLVNKYFISLTKDEFYRYYQLFRNYLHVLDNKNDLLIVVYPRKNLKLELDFNRFMTILNNKLIHKYNIYQVRKIHYEELFEYIYNVVDHEDLKNQLDEFKVKYLF